MRRSGSLRLSPAGGGNAIIKQHEGVLEEEFEDLVFEVIGDLCAHLKDPAQGRLQGRDMK